MRLYKELPKCTRAAEFVKGNGGVTVEVGDLLYALTRMVKPMQCVETGSFHGFSALRIGQAILANGRGGSLVTCEIDPEKVDITKAAVIGLPVIVAECKGIEFLQKTQINYDFAFIDSGGQAEREDEIRCILDRNLMYPGGIIAVHDICEGYENLYDLLSTQDWPHLVFPSIVGIGIFQKPF